MNRITVKNLQLKTLEIVEIEDLKREDLITTEGGNIFLGFGPWNMGFNLGYRAAGTSLELHRINNQQQQRTILM